MTPLQAAFDWWTAGTSVVPAAADGSKRPWGQWKQYQNTRASPQQLQQWFGAGHPGIGVICGKVSGGLEMLEFEGRAVQEGMLDTFAEIACDSGLGELWFKLCGGYSEETPSGGIHFVYRVVDGEPLGNTKLARRPAAAAELESDPDDRVKVLIETRGEGGFVVIAPSGGPVHPSGKPWTTTTGPASVVELTAGERDALFSVARSLDAMPLPPEPEEQFLPGRPQAERGLTPGDDFEARTAWAEILTGWDLLFTRGRVAYWRRPGKRDRAISATTGRADDRDRLYVFSTSTPFDAERPYTKFAAYALLNHGGDYSAAARELSARGYGGKREAPAPREAPEVTEGEPALRRVVGLRASEVKIRRTRWLWRDRVPLGGLALLAGKGDVSKSTLFAQFAAWITKGEMKGEFYGKPQDVAYVVNEDSMHETVVPRLVAAGADLSRIHFLKVAAGPFEDALSLPRDSDILRDFITETGVVATFIDPLSANVTGKANDQREIRNTYQHINNIAEQTSTSVWGLAHTRKAGAADVIEAIIGSSEQANVARSVHGLVMDPEEDGARILSCEKLNVGQKGKLTSLRFTLDSVNVHCTDGTGDVTSMPRIRWLEEVVETASDVLGDQLNGTHGVDQCTSWLRQYLITNGGEAYKADIETACKGKFNQTMLQRSRKVAKIASRRSSEQHGPAIWYFPEAFL